ncbi:hypothetical protein [Anaerophaga thermohalophila]|jgi:hypothetical protein|uniref:hypothetical protein n=1 Tax=Anaerophaga thermohalophila TaxID=177400 RepID=UPI000237C639|nr:hypothetical protein [Anaerophaga thermohalophila]
MTVKEALTGLSGYPIPGAALENIASKRGLDLGVSVNTETRTSSAFRLSEADVLMWLSMAPSISEEGVNISLSEVEKRRFKDMANIIYQELGDSAYQPNIRQVFSYEGDDV